MTPPAPRVLLASADAELAVIDLALPDTHVAGLRAKLEDDPARPLHILTVRKAGYRLQR